MAKRKNPFSRIRVIYHRTPTLVKCVVLATVIVCTAALLTLTVAISQEHAQEEALRSEAAILEQQNDALEEDISELGTVQSIKKLAKKLLGLVDPDTVIFAPEQ